MIVSNHSVPCDAIGLGSSLEERKRPASEAGRFVMQNDAGCLLAAYGY